MVPQTRRALSLLILVALSGCAVGPDYVRPKLHTTIVAESDTLPNTTETADTKGGEVQHIASDEDVTAKWWEILHSDAINNLIGRAIEENADICAARAALRQAEQNLYARESGFFPFFDVKGSIERQKSIASTKPVEIQNAGVAASYTLDVFGSTRRQIEASRAQVESQRFQLESTYLNLVTNILTTAIQLASIHDQIAATQQIIRDEQQELSILNEQLQMGAIAKGDLLTQQAQLLATKASLPALEKQEAQLRHSLSYLSGQFPEDAGGSKLTLSDLQLPTELPKALPARLIEQRPDVRIAEAQLKEASADVGVATGNMLPQLTISAGYNGASSSSSFGQSLISQNPLWSLASNVSAPIFHGGELWHYRKAAIANLDEAREHYRSVVEQAFSHVSDTLSALEADAQVIKWQDEAERTAHESLEISRERVRMGAVSYLSFLDAERTYQQARISLISAKATRFSDTVTLFQMLGGGWWNRKDS